MANLQKNAFLSSPVHSTRREVRNFNFRVKEGGVVGRITLSSKPKGFSYITEGSVWKNGRRSAHPTLGESEETFSGAASICLDKQAFKKTQSCSSGNDH